MELTTTKITLTFIISIVGVAIFSKIDLRMMAIFSISFFVAVAFDIFVYRPIIDKFTS